MQSRHNSRKSKREKSRRPVAGVGFGIDDKCDNAAKLPNADDQASPRNINFVDPDGTDWKGVENSFNRLLQVKEFARKKVRQGEKLPGWKVTTHNYTTPIALSVSHALIQKFVKSGWNTKVPLFVEKKERLFNGLIKKSVKKDITNLFELVNNARGDKLQVI